MARPLVLPLLAALLSIATRVAAEPVELSLLQPQLSNILEMSATALERGLAQLATSVRGKLSPGVAPRLQAMSDNEMLATLLDDEQLGDFQSPETAPLREAVQQGVLDIIMNILKIVEKLLGLLREPAYFGNLNLNFNNSAVMGYLSLGKLKVGHLRDIYISRYRINHILKGCLGVDVEAPTLYLTVSPYDIDLEVNLDPNSADDKFHLFGRGPGRLDFTNIKLRTDICVEVRKLNIEVKNLQISLEKGSVDLKNFFGGEAISELISGIATDILPAVIEELQPELTELIMDLINKLLSSIKPNSTLPFLDTMKKQPLFG